MLARLSLLVCAACCAIGPAAAQAPPSPAAQRAWELSAQLTQLLAWWPGEYDNHEQIVRQSGGGLSPPTRSPFYRIHTTVRVLAAPQLGEHVLSLVSNADDDPARPVRAEVVVASIDASARAIRVQRFSAANAEQLRDADAAARLQPRDLKSLGSGCDLLLRYAGGQFEGGLASNSCPASRGNSEYQLIVGPRYVWERDQGRDPASKAIVWEMAPGSEYDWYQQTRARPFTCMVFENDKGEMAKTRYLTTIHLHDQGGTAEIAWPDGRTLVFTIHRRAFTSTLEREYPLFRIHEKGSPVPLAYAYAVDDSTRFGLNLGWFYVRCYADSDVAPAEIVEGRK